MQTLTTVISGYRGTQEGWPWTEGVDPSRYQSEKWWPKISIITPSLNQADFLEQTIRSVLMQRYPNLEYIIMDGGSHDGSVEIIEKYSEFIQYWSTCPDHGQSDALNKGFRMATGDIFAWINSDDFYDQDAFYKVAVRYKEKPFALMCGSCKMITSDGDPIRTLYTERITNKTLVNYWRPNFCPPQPSIFFQGSILRELGYFNVDLKYAMDFDLWLRAIDHYSFTIVNENLSFYRVHIHSKTGSEGGLRKFIPEWKMLIDKSYHNKPLPSAFLHRLEENIYLTKKKLQKLIAFTKIKSFLKKWRVS